MGSESLLVEVPWRQPGFDRAYWLRSCHGFGVFDAKGRLGVVEEVLYGGYSSEMPETLLVRAGLFGRRQVRVAVEDVAEVIPRETRIVLGSSRRRA